MSLSLKEKILCIALLLELILHMDVWAWDRIHPVWLQAFPYHVLWGTLEVVVILAVFLWWGFSCWEDVTDELAVWGEKIEKITSGDPVRPGRSIGESIDSVGRGVSKD